MNHFIKILSGFIFSFFIFTAITSTTVAASLQTYFFYGDGCPHCAKERIFLEKMINKYPELVFNDFEIYHNQENVLLLQRSAEILGSRADGVPFLIIGDKNFVGFNDSLSPTEIEEQIKTCLKNSCPDSIAPLFGIVIPSDEQNNQPDQEAKTEPIVTTTNTIPESEIEKTSGNLNLPIVGEVGITDFSLPILTIIIGALDGFNPCAMWTLLFLISLLIGTKSRNRRWFLGGAFIAASAAVYFIFLAAWLNLIIFLGFIIWIKLIIGLLALFGGVYNLKEFLFNKESGCKIIQNNGRRKTFEKIKNIVQQKNFFLALGGIILLAAAVNLVELICSAGLPAIYTQILTLNNLNPWQYYFYLLLYIFFFMLDDLFVFFITMITLEMTGITTKYTRLSKLIGGLLMLAIGILLIFKPEWLMFG
ncbi:MAG: hypothetical protein UX09_C0032G0010 [Candidatus Uhrbacteria bacterium GW2011_GWE2_45_35]|uniref:Thioredoxin domain-containing protein n=2 Tax=Candidatus Uhriibacteriota TaxID=1752732 RepID=A0A0G1JGE6_9BACT|nr:MAG: hypothetical protein UW63_C0026G0010 [Candidatus Uhrbacteria bacterium GW2011_GWF2_44_350]KKU07277.1 MAG: hypothetical protein UX09_C0032G0010 [Candidatus Uhrbacteria bacterium GW2011_GWE2_45_35]HBR80423.1 hypothetical protein [Candidatus Uhrbacteria bacterium]HCU31186.1 hypothetical protein [Candidatus Uhrbacteria bacterium]